MPYLPLTNPKIVEDPHNWQPHSRYGQTENRIYFDCKIGYTTGKIISTLILPSIHFHFSSLLTHSSHTVQILHLTIHPKLTSAHPSLLMQSHCHSELHPMHWRERESFNNFPTLVRAPPHTLMSTTVIFPSALVSFLLFLLRLAQPHLWPFQAHLKLCMYPIYRAIILPHTDKALPSSNIFDPWLYHRRCWYHILSTLDLHAGPWKIQKYYFLSMGPREHPKWCDATHSGIRAPEVPLSA